MEIFILDTNVLLKILGNSYEKEKKIRKDKYFKFFIKDSQGNNYPQTIINFNYNNPTKLTKDPKFKTKIIILFIRLENPFQKL